MRIRGSGKTEIKCKECGKNILIYKCHLPRKKYCSKLCRDNAHSKQFIGRDFGGHEYRNCIICGKQFKVYKSEKKYVNRECCSRKCRDIAHGQKIKGEKHHFWQGGTKAWRGCDWKYIKLKILKRDNYKCQKCGKTKRLHIHHIKPYRISKDNSENNLITLCMSCHMKTEIALWNGIKII